MEALACDIIVFRAMTKKHWIDLAQTPPVAPAAYILRSANQLRPAERTLSVGVGSAAAAVKHLKGTHGTASLHVGCVRQCETEPGKCANLNVVPDEPTEEYPDPDPEHANIINVPHPDTSPEDFVLANQIAFALSRQSRFVPIPKAG